MFPSGLYFGSEDPLAPVERAPWHHQALTKQACRDEGWAEQAAVECSWSTVGVDLYSYHPIWRVQGGPKRWRTGTKLLPWLDLMHFDDLPDVMAVEKTWNRIMRGSRAALDITAANQDVSGARHVIGVGLHAVQDFYSHSTWINDVARRETTWLEAETPARLSTGRFLTTDEETAHHGGQRRTIWAALRLPGMLLEPLTQGLPRGLKLPRGLELPWGLKLPRGVMPGEPAGINLDSRWQAEVAVLHREGLDLAPGDAFDLAYGLAARDSRNWLRLMFEHLEPEFAEQVRQGPTGSWTEVFERPGKPLLSHLAF